MKEIHDVLKISLDRLDNETKNNFLIFHVFLKGKKENLFLEY